MCRVGEGDTDTMSDIYLAMMCIVECTSLVEMTQTLHLISVLSCLCIVVCAGLVKKYSQVMQRYYVQYLSNYDALCLNSIIQVRHCLYRDAVTWKIKFSSIRYNNK